MDPLTIGATVAFAVAFFLVFGRRYLRTQKALREPIGSDVCVACSATAITTFAPDCHRCDGCGFIWGDGLAERAAAERRSKIEALAPEERHRFAVSELKEADARLRAAEVALEHAGKQLGLDMIAGGGLGAGDMYSRARNEGVVTAASEMGLAQKHIRNTADATGWAIEAAGAPIDFHSPVFALDVIFDSMLVDVAGHLQVDKLRKQATDMRRSIAQALAALESR